MSGMYEGGCLCGGVRYGFNAAPKITADCYCVDCRKSSGTSHCTHAAVPLDDFVVEGTLKFYDRPADSGNVVSRGFCPECGSPVYSTNDGLPGLVFVRVSSLDNPTTVAPMITVYASRAPGWARLDPDNPSFPEMPDGGAQQALSEN
ncbi:MAG: GFA family protein [Rhodospirillales bacterium]|nr:GFA family protein [Rhodospirillales bacterium]MBO6787954.1 GFA family protein [Rhodospirillales bacterium]